MLLEAAQTVLARFGLRKTTLEDIAREAGVGRASIYHYFASKEEIFSAVIRQESELLLDIMSDAVKEADSGRDKFVAFVKSRYHHLRDLKSLHAVTDDVARELIPLAEKERQRFFSRELEMLERVIRLGVANGEFAVPDVELFALAAMSGLRGLDSTFWIYGKHDRIDEGIDSLLAAIIHGIEVR